MKKYTASLLLPGLLLLAACGNRPSDQTDIPKTDTPGPAAAETAGPRCFLKAFNRDTTRVRLEIAGDSVHGTMTWHPWEKDGAEGTLTGIQKDGELNLLYSYTIEGSQQTETKLIKLDGGTLRIKTGELEDPAADGNLRYKDPAKATYSEVLEEVPCP